MICAATVVCDCIPALKRGGGAISAYDSGSAHQSTAFLAAAHRFLERE